MTSTLRRNAKDERVLFHYNGHGVPKPTANGEIWVFNRSYTQYIPLSIYDLQTWMWSPSIYVFDCSNAGMIVDAFQQFADQHQREYEQLMAQSRNALPPQMTPAPNFKQCIQLAACATNQILPMNSELPADLFTACLTTPIKVIVFDSRLPVFRCFYHHLITAFRLHCVGSCCKTLPGLFRA